MRLVKLGRWFNGTCPSIAARAKAEGAIIYSGDGAVAAEGRCWIRDYALAGKTPVMAAPSKRRGLSMISVISNLGLVKFEFIEEAMNTKLLIGFMGRLIEGSAQKTFLILDHLKVNHAKLVAAWFAGRKDRIEVFDPLPYSQGINPDECLGRDFREELRSLCRAETNKSVLQKAVAFMDFLAKPPERVMVYSKHLVLRYAA